MSTRPSRSLLLRSRLTALAWSALALTAPCGFGPLAEAQDVPPAATGSKPAPDASPPVPGDNIRYGYVIHQSIDLGGHIADYSGSGAVYDTMVNLQSGPRILAQSLSLQAVDPSHALLFDHLSTNSFGYGGDPNNVSLLNVEKGKIYNLRGSFRRDRQYFDYDLLANPLIPPASNPFVPVLDSTHLYNTVRRMTDLDLTLAPLSPVSVRLGYNRIVSEGPSYSTIHVGTEAQLLQSFRNSTDTWTAGIDWRANKRSTVSYDEFITHYKGDTNWQLTGLNYKRPLRAPLHSTRMGASIQPAMPSSAIAARRRSARSLLPNNSAFRVRPYPVSA
jgi:hypothetical protein